MATSGSSGSYSSDEDESLSSSSITFGLEAQSYTSVSSPADDVDDQLKKSAGSIIQEEHCHCISLEEFTGEWPFSGWERRTVDTAHSFHFIAPPNFNKFLNIFPAYGTSGPQKVRPGSGNRLLRSKVSTVNLASESKSSLQSYIHSTPTIPYTFQHFVDGSTSEYIEEYRNSYTYPNLKESIKKKKGTICNYVKTVKPKLFVLDGSVQNTQRPMSAGISRQKKEFKNSKSTSETSFSGQLFTTPYKGHKSLHGKLERTAFSSPPLRKKSEHESSPFQSKSYSDSKKPNHPTASHQQIPHHIPIATPEVPVTYRPPQFCWKPAQASKPLHKHSRVKSAGSNEQRRSFQEMDTPADLDLDDALAWTTSSYRPTSTITKNITSVAPHQSSTQHTHPRPVSSGRDSIINLISKEQLETYLTGASLIPKAKESAVKSTSMAMLNATMSVMNLNDPIDQEKHTKSGTTNSSKTTFHYSALRS